MSRAIPMLRLTPQAAGALQQQYKKAIKELHDINRLQQAARSAQSN